MSESEVLAEPHAAPREYAWRMPVNWWVRKRHYFFYMLREFTAVPLALWLLWFLVEVQRASGGPAKYSPHGSTGFVAFSVICLGCALYHSVTFLNLSGLIIRVKVVDRQLPSRMVSGAMFAAWAAASVVVGFVLIWFAR